MQGDAKRLTVLGGADVHCRRVTTSIEFDQRAVNKAAETLAYDEAKRLMLFGGLNCFGENLYRSRLVAAGERRYDALGAPHRVLLPDSHRASEPAK